MIRLSVNDDQIKHFCRLDTAKAAWSALKDAYERDKPEFHILMIKHIICEEHWRRTARDVGTTGVAAMRVVNTSGLPAQVGRLSNMLEFANRY